MKKILLILLLLPLLVLAQDPKPIPYNAKFMGYVQIESLKDKSNKGLINAYVLVDTITGKLYAVSLDSLGGTTIDTTHFINSRFGNNTMYQDFIFNKNLIDNTTNITSDANSLYNNIRGCFSYGVTLNNAKYNDIIGVSYGLTIDTSNNNTIRNCSSLNLKKSSTNILHNSSGTFTDCSNNFAINAQNNTMSTLSGNVFINQNGKSYIGVSDNTYIGKDIYLTDLDTSKQLMQLYFNPSTKQITCGDTAQGGGTTDTSTITGTLATTRIPYASGLHTLIDEAALNYDATNNILNVDKWQPATNIATPTYSKGLIWWDATDNALSYHTDINGTSVQIGQEMLVRVINKTGSTITNGQVVYISGAQGNRAKVSLAKADAELTSESTIGIATSDINIDTVGYICTTGLVRDLNTNGLGVGSTVYLSASTAGAYTTTAPTAPNHRVKLGTVIVDHPTHGQIYCSVDDGEELSELHDVLITSPRNNAILIRDSVAGVWKDTVSTYLTGNLWDNDGNNFASPNNKIGTTGANDLLIIANNTTAITIDKTTRGLGIGGAVNGTNKLSVTGTSYFSDNLNFTTKGIITDGGQGLVLRGTSGNGLGLNVDAGSGINVNGIASNSNWYIHGFLATPAYTITLNGNLAKSISMERHTTANTAGNSLTISSGGSTSGATDKSSGRLILSTGTSTGNEADRVYIYTPDTAQGAGTTDRTPVAQVSLGYNGITLHGNATVWDDLFFPVTSLKSLGATDKPDYDVTNLGLLFPKNDTTENVGVVVQMNHQWKQGSSIYPHIHWIQTSADTATWKIKYRVYNIGGTIPAWTIITSNNHSVNYTSGTIHQLAEFPAISMTGKTLSCIIDMIIYRSDNLLTGDALFKQFDIHYEKDGIGSQTEYSKY